MKNDCFAMKNGECIALNTTQCDNCVFYCSGTDMTRRRKEAHKYISRLDITAQQYIADKYFGGVFVWKENRL